MLTLLVLPMSRMWPLTPCLHPSPCHSLETPWEGPSQPLGTRGLHSQAGEERSQHPAGTSWARKPGDCWGQKARFPGLCHLESPVCPLYLRTSVHLHLCSLSWETVKSAHHVHPSLKTFTRPFQQHLATSHSAASALTH